MLFFFFFQAEDGIRDLTVTGVQTCALPISGAVTPGSDSARGVQRIARSAGAVSLNPRRSGERRVGEEGRSRGGPDHLKKKKKKKIMYWERRNKKCEVRSQGSVDDRVGGCRC